MATSAKRTRIAIGLLIVAALVLYFAALSQYDPWVSRKGVPRDFGDVEFFTAEETPIPPARAFRRSEITREEAADKLSFIWEDTRQGLKRSWKGRVPPRFTDDERQVVTLPGGGQIRLAWASMGYDPNLRDFPVKEPFERTQVTVRGDTWEALDEEGFREIRPEEWRKNIQFPPRLSSWGPGHFSLNLALTYEGLPDLRVASGSEVMNLDTMSGVEMRSGGTLNCFPGSLTEHFPVEVFYPARLAIGFDVAYGPTEEVRLPIKQGSRAALSELEIEIVAVERFACSVGQNDTLLSRSGDWEKHATWFQFDPGGDPRTYVLFSLSPPELGRCCDIVLIDRDGESKRTYFHDGSPLQYVTTDILPENLDQMTLRYRPNQARVVFELPPLRGTPAVNHEVDNLFDVEIPHLKASQAFETEWTISKQAGVRFNFPDAQFPEGYFPHFYEKVTLRELLEETLEHHPNGDRVRLDRKTHTLEIPEPFSFKKLWKDIRKRLGV